MGGAAGRVLSQFGNRPVYVVGSTSHNNAIGHGANPAEPGTPGGGSGGAIYNDGNTL